MINWLHALQIALIGVGSVSLEYEAQRAQAFVEAGKPQEAIDIYHRLLSQGPTGEQNLRIKYNLASAHLHAEEWSEAQHILEELLALNLQDPLLRRRTLTHHAHAQLAQVPIDGEVDQIDHRMRQLQEANKSCLLAISVEQDLSGSQGIPSDLQALHQRIKEVAQTLIERRNEAIEPTSIQQAIHSLESRLVRDLDRLEEALARCEPIQSQLQVLAGRAEQELFSTQARVARGGESQLASRLQEALTEHQQARVALGELRGWEALGHEVSALADLRAARCLCGDSTGLCSALQERCRFLARWSQHEGVRVIESRYREGLCKMCLELSEPEVLNQLLLNRLRARLGHTPPSISDAMVRANQDWWFFRQISEAEENTLLDLIQRIKEGHIPQDFESRLYALREKVSGRLELCQQETEHLPLVQTHQALDEALQETDLEVRLQCLESALRALSPFRWLAACLQDLEQRCKQVLKNERLSQEALKRLSVDQRQLEPTLNQLELRESHPVALHEIEHAYSDVGLALTMLNKGRERLATLGLEDATVALGAARESLLSKHDQPAAAVLKRAIDCQEAVRTLTSQLAAEDRKEAVGADFHDMLSKDELRVIEQIHPFFAAVANQAGDDKTAARSERVDAAVRLVREGMEGASTVRQHMSSDDLDWVQADLLQNIVLEKWRKALTMLDAPENPSDGEDDRQEGKRPSNASGEHHEASPSAELLNLLQKMDEEDRPREPQKLTPRGGSRPW